MGLLGSIGKGLAAPFAPGVALPGASELIGDMVTGGAISNAKAVSETNDKQIGLMREQMAYQERLSNSAYQRAVEDMRKAGLNPALAYQNGGASTPSGAMATLEAPKRGEIGAGLANTAKTAATMGAQISNTNSQTSLNHANVQVADTQQAKNLSNAKESDEAAKLNQKLQEKATADAEASRENAKLRKMERKKMEGRQQIDQDLAPVDAVMERVDNALGTAGSAARTFLRGKGNSRPSGSWSPP